MRSRSSVPRSRVSQATKDKRRDAYLRTKWNITLQQYNEIKEAQGGKCYICRIATGKARALAVDHNHETGEIRGLLCLTCNKIILPAIERGWYKRGLAYLKNP